MGDNWTKIPFEKAVAINPSRTIAKGTIAPHISMDTLQPFIREIRNFEMKEFKGSGSRFQNGDTLLARITPCLENGKTALVSCLPDDTVGHGSTEFIVLSSKEGISDNLFVYYLSREPELRNYAIQQMEGSTGRQRVPAKALANLTLDLPPLPEQKAIASILGALDDKIELNGKMNETLEAMARAIFKSWFVDFLPVRAKMAAVNKHVPSLPAAKEGQWFVYTLECEDGSFYIGHTEDLQQRWQQHVCGKGAQWTKAHPPIRIAHCETLSSQQEAVKREKWLKTGFGRKWLKRQVVANARTQTGDPIPGFAPHKEWQDSPLGKIPKEWRVGTLGEMCEIVMGQSPPGETYNETEEGLPFYQGIRDFGFRFPAKRVHCTAPTRIAKEGDVLLSVRAPVGSLNIASEECAVGRGVAALRIKKQHYGFLYYLMKETQWGWEKFEAEGTVFGSATKTDVQNFSAIFPPSQIICRFNETAFPIDNMIKNNETQSRTLAAIRDAVLPKLLSGELRVKDVERFVEETRTKTV